jgi:hypothetical protein
VHDESIDSDKELAGGRITEEGKKGDSSFER